MRNNRAYPPIMSPPSYVPCLTSTEALGCSGVWWFIGGARRDSGRARNRTQTKRYDIILPDSSVKTRALIVECRDSQGSIRRRPWPTPRNLTLVSHFLTFLTSRVEIKGGGGGHLLFLFFYIIYFLFFCFRCSVFGTGLFVCTAGVSFLFFFFCFFFIFFFRLLAFCVFPDSIRSNEGWGNAGRWGERWGERERCGRRA